MKKLLKNTLLLTSVIYILLFFTFCNKKNNKENNKDDFRRAYKCIACDRQPIKITDLVYNDVPTRITFNGNLSLSPTVTPASYTNVRSIFILKGSLPSGVYFNSLSGKIFGKALEVGNFSLNVTIKAAYGAEGSAEAKFEFEVTPFPTSFTNIKKISYTNNGQILDITRLIDKGSTECLSPPAPATDDGTCNGYNTSSFLIATMMPEITGTMINANEYTYQLITTGDSEAPYESFMNDGTSLIPSDDKFSIDTGTGVISGMLPTPRPRGELQSDTTTNFRTKGSAAWTFEVQISSNSNLVATVPVNIYASYRWTPIPDAMNVPVNHPITFFFGLDMNEQNLNELFVVEKENPSKVVPSKIIREHRLVTIKFNEDLKQGTEYQIRNGENNVSSFTTASGDSPKDYRRGVLVSTKDDQTYTTVTIRALINGINSLLGGDEQFDAKVFERGIFTLRQIYDVKIASVTYTSVDLNGSLANESGLYSYPNENSTFRSNEELGVVVFHHGTTFNRKVAPSESSFACRFFEVTGKECKILDGDLPIVARLNTFFATTVSSDGAITILPDIQGLGVSSKDEPHFYLNSYISADNGIDMVKAIRDSLPIQITQLIRPYTGITGYSEGGLIAIAHARVAELRYYEDPKNMPDLTFGGAGPYDMLTALRSFYLPNALAGEHTLLYLDYIRAAMYGFNDTYKTNLNLGFSTPMNVSGFPKLVSVDGSFPKPDINGPIFRIATTKQRTTKSASALYQHDHKDRLIGLNEKAYEINVPFAEEFLNERSNISDSFILSDILRLNSVEDWKPRSGIDLFQAKFDPQVPVFSSEDAYNNYIKDNDYNKKNLTLDNGSCDQESIPKDIDENDNYKILNSDKFLDPHSNCFINFLARVLNTYFLKADEQ